MCSAAVLSEEQLALHGAQLEMEGPAAAAAERKLQQQRPTSELKVVALLKQAQQTPRVGKRIRLIQEAASLWADDLASLTACQRGCSACCYLPVVISSAEAQRLAQASGRMPCAPPGAVSVAQAAGAGGAPELLQPGRVGGPCPFLVEEECSVYDARPVACRTHVSLADSALLCQIVPGHPARVPYADSTKIHGYALLLQLDQVVADIRDFFPETAAG